MVLRWVVSREYAQEFFFKKSPKTDTKNPYTSRKRSQKWRFLTSQKWRSFERLTYSCFSDGTLPIASLQRKLNFFRDRKQQYNLRFGCLSRKSNHGIDMGFFSFFDELAPISICVFMRPDTSLAWYLQISDPIYARLYGSRDSYMPALPILYRPLAGGLFIPRM